MKFLFILFFNLLSLNQLAAAPLNAQKKDAREAKLVPPFKELYKEIKGLEGQYTYWKILSPLERKNFDLFKEEVLNSANQDSQDVGLRVETLEKLKSFRMIFVEQKLSQINKNDWLHKTNSRLRELEQTFLLMGEVSEPADDLSH